MQFVCRSVPIVLAAAWACAGLNAVEVGIGRQTIERALQLGQRGADERNRFHSRYVIRVGHPTVNSFEVMTEFRRVVVAGEERLRIGDRGFDARDAEQLLQTWRGRLSIVAHLRFNPQNAYVTVPSYDMSLDCARDAKEIAPREVQRNPLYADTTLVGADIEGTFDAAPLAQSKCTVVLRLPPGQLAAAAIDFGSLE